MTHAVILGIGNVLLTDDGAGVHAARALAQRLAGRTDVTVLDAGTLSLTLAPLIESAARLIVLDAAELHHAPGSVQRFLGSDFDAFLGRGRLSVHELGLRDVMDACRMTDSLPTDRALLGIQPASLDWGTELTPLITAGLTELIHEALELLEAWPSRTAAHGEAA